MPHRRTGWIFWCPIPIRSACPTTRFLPPGVRSARPRVGQDPKALADAEKARVAVLNGSSTGGIAAKTSAYLKDQGLNVTKEGNADRLYTDTTIVIYSGKPYTAGFPGDYNECAQCPGPQPVFSGCRHRYRHYAGSGLGPQEPHALSKAKDVKKAGRCPAFLTSKFPIYWPKVIFQPPEKVLPPALQEGMLSPCATWPASPARTL